MKMKKIWRLSQILAWVGVTHPGQMPLMTSTLTQTIEWVGLDGNQSNRFTYLGQSERHFCTENNCFLFLIQKKLHKLLIDGLKATSANSDLSRVALCRQQTAAWTRAMHRPYPLAHREVLPVHIYVTDKTGSLVLFLKYSDTCVWAHQHNYRSVKRLCASAHSQTCAFYASVSRLSALA